MPVSLTRTYRQAESNSYSFGVGTASPFDLHLWSTENYKTAYLVLPDGGKVKLNRTSRGAAMPKRNIRPSKHLGNGRGDHGFERPDSDWILTRRDGMKFSFGVYAPLQ